MKNITLAVYALLGAVLICCVLWLTGDLHQWLHATEQAAINDITRVSRVELEFSGLANAGRDFIRGNKKRPEDGLPGLTAALIRNTDSLGGAATSLGSAASDLGRTAQATTGLIGETRGTVKEARNVLVNFSNLMQSDDVQGSIRNVHLLTADAHNVGLELSAFLDPDKGFPAGVYRSEQDINAITTDLKFWTHRNTAKPRLITTIINKSLDIGFKAAVIAKP